MLVAIVILTITVDTAGGGGTSVSGAYSVVIVNSVATVVEVVVVELGRRGCDGK